LHIIPTVIHQGQKRITYAIARIWVYCKRQQVSIMLATFEYNIPPIIHQLQKRTTCAITRVWGY